MDWPPITEETIVTVRKLISNLIDCRPTDIVDKMASSLEAESKIDPLFVFFIIILLS